MKRCDMIHFLSSQVCPPARHTMLSPDNACESMIVGVACKGVCCSHRQGTFGPVPAVKRHSVLPCNVRLSWLFDPMALGGRGDWLIIHHSQCRLGSGEAISGYFPFRVKNTASLLGVRGGTCLSISMGEDSTLGRDRPVTIIKARDHRKSMVERSRVG